MGCVDISRPSPGKEHLEPGLRCQRSYGTFAPLIEKNNAAAYHCHTLIKQFSAHHAYVSEVSAHWISAYFQRDALRLPQSIEEAIGAAEQDGAWVRRRYPHTLDWINESNTSAVAFWT
jgi:hypothetical protein